jgi:hypothetical protein
LFRWFEIFFKTLIPQELIGKLSAKPDSIITKPKQDAKGTTLTFHLQKAAEDVSKVLIAPQKGISTVTPEQRAMLTKFVSFYCSFCHRLTL